jgi:hypothetical protein
MAKQCRDCRRHGLLVDLNDEADSVYYCEAHQIVLDPSRLNGPACAQARFSADRPSPAPRRARGR